MEIQYLGHSSFRIRGKKTIVVTDPFAETIGLKMPRVSADIVTVSHQHEDHNYVDAISGTVRRRQPFVVNGPGEYEIANVFINGFSSWHDSLEGKKRGKNTIFLITMENLRLVHLGDLGHQLSEEKLELINGVDVLLIPIGGNYTIGPKTAVKLINQIQPTIVIPMHYYVKGLKVEIGEVEPFLKEIGVEVRPQEKLMITRESLPEEREVVLLSKRD